MSTGKSILKKTIAMLTVIALVITLLPASMTYAATKNELTAKVAGEGYLKVQWQFEEDGLCYELYRAPRVDGKAGTYINIYTSSCEPGDEDLLQNCYEDTSAKPGKVYYYRLVVLDRDGKKINETKALKYVFELEKPSISSIYTDIASGDPTIKWEKVRGAEKYQVWRSTSKKGTYKRVNTVTKTSYVDTKAPAGKTYYYKIRAVSEVNSEYSAIKSAKAAKADKKLATAVKNASKKNVTTLEKTMSLISKTDISNLAGFDGGFYLCEKGKLKFSDVFTSAKIKAAGGTLKLGRGCNGDPFHTQYEVHPQKNNVKYSPFRVDSYGMNIHKVKKGSTKKATIDSIKKTVNKYYPSKKWTVTVEKYDAKKHKGEIKDMTGSYNYWLEKSGYKKYQSNKYVLKIKNKANSKKQSWAFVTAVPTLKK